MSKRMSVGLMVTGIVALAATATILWKTNAPKDEQPSKPNTVVQTFTGEIVCLPKPGDGPHTMECALGLKASNQKYYALKNNPQYDLPVNTNVAVTGKVAAPSSDEIYDIAGTIDVSSIKPVEQ